MTCCRACGNNEWKPYIEFGPQPISTILHSEEASNAPRYQFDFDWCCHCGHVQVRDAIDLTDVYNEYPRMRSTTVAPYVADLALKIKNLMQPEDSVLEIASNDGMFIEYLKKCGLKNVYGVESATNCVQAAKEAGIETINAFFNLDFAKEFVEKHGKLKVIVARHVVEHIDDLDDFMKGIVYALRDDGIAVIEVPDIQWAIDKGDFTSFTEQHISYFSRHSLKSLLCRHGLKCHDLSIVPNNWSDALLTFSTLGNAKSEDTVLSYESRAAFTNNAKKTEQALKALATEGKVGLFGGFCRTANLLNFTSLHEIEDRFIVLDDDSRKIDKYLPGSKRSIKPFSALTENGLKHCIICAVNYEERIIANHKEYGETGTFMTLFPFAEVAPK